MPDCEKIIDYFTYSVCQNNIYINKFFFFTVQHYKKIWFLFGSFINCTYIKIISMFDKYK